MDINVGEYDGYVRIFLGTLLAAAGITGYVGVIRVAFGPLPQALNSVVLVLIGAVLLLTGFRKKCLIYELLGIDTS